MVLMTNICETCGDGQFTVTHHEAAHRCPVCELRAELVEALQDASEVAGLRQELRDKEDTITDLENDVTRLEDQREELKDQVADLEEQVKELEEKVEKMEEERDA